MSAIEDLYDQLGGMGRFQVMTSLLIGLCQVPIGWSMLQMSFAGVIPEFHCFIQSALSSAEESLDGSVSATDLRQDKSNSTGVSELYPNQTLNACSLNGSRCDSYTYDTSARTIITEWDLVCDMKWVKKVIISLQMAGVLLGTVAAGQISDMLGRKKVLYCSVFAHAVLNLIAGFSVHWIMFCCMRFLIGICIGAIIVVVTIFQMEFLPTRWRAILIVIPSFTLGVAIFAAFAVILEDWSLLHHACAALTIISVCGGIYVPESPRWLAVQGRLNDAESVMKRMSVMNKKSLPVNTMDILQSIQTNNKESDNTVRKYTYLDLFKTKQRAKISLVFFYFWFISAVVYYGISFGIGSFSGNLYLNIFLLGVMEIPMQTVTFFLNNRFGRRKTTFLFYTLCFMPLLGCLVFSETSSGLAKGVGINVLSLVAKMMIGPAWASVHVWGTESFPTVTRNLGGGFSSLGARVGGIVAPFVIDLDDLMSLSYAICCVLLLFGMVLSFFIPETKGKVLKDTVDCAEDPPGFKMSQTDGMEKVVNMSVKDESIEEDEINELLAKSTA